MEDHAKEPTAPKAAPASVEEPARTASYLRPLTWLYGSSLSIAPAEALPEAPSASADSPPATDLVSGANVAHALSIVSPAVPSNKLPTSSSGSSPAPSPRSYGSWLASVAGSSTGQQRPSATATKSIGLGADVGEVMNVDDEESAKQAGSLRPSPPSSVRTQKSSFFSAISKSPSASSLVGQVSAKVVPLTTPVAVKPKAGPSRTAVAAIAPPNLVLPSFDDIFSRPPRSVPPPLPRRSGLAKKALGALGLVAEKNQRALSPAEERVRLGKERGLLLPKTLAIATGRTRRPVRRVVILAAHGWFPIGITRRVGSRCAVFCVV